MNIKQLIAEVEGAGVVIRPDRPSKPYQGQAPLKSFPTSLNPQDADTYDGQFMGGNGWTPIDADGNGVIDYWIKARSPNDPPQDWNGDGIIDDDEMNRGLYYEFDLDGDGRPDSATEEEMLKALDIPDDGGGDDDVPIEGEPWPNMPPEYEELLDVAFDSDGDGVTDYWIMEDGHIFIDTDGDGMPDGLYVSPEPFQGLENQNPNWMNEWEDWILDNIYNLENFQDQFGPGVEPGNIGEEGGPPDWIPVNENGYVYDLSYPFGPGMDHDVELEGGWHWDPAYIGDLPQHNGWVWYQEAVG